jgi:hypothetical protein
MLDGQLVHPSMLWTESGCIRESNTLHGSTMVIREALISLILQARLFYSLSFQRPRTVHLAVSGPLTNLGMKFLSQDGR